MSSKTGKKDFWDMSASQNKATLAVGVLIGLLCVASIAVREIRVNRLHVELSQMDSLQIIPTPVRSDTFLIDINVISQKELASHPLVRDTLAEKLFRARVRYGGFLNALQMEDIFPDDEKIHRLFPYMLYDASKIVRYDINIDDEDMLCEHPYISRPFARSIIEYRQRVGFIEDYATMKKIKYFPRSKAEYLEQYINFEKREHFSLEN